MSGSAGDTGLPFSGEAAPGDGEEAHKPRIDGYEIMSRIGRGGMGEVWLAKQLSTRRQVALKAIGMGVFDSKEARARFVREVELTANLRHPGIVTVYESGLTNGQCWYAMELIEGKPLDDFVNDASLDRAAILRLMSRVCLAVDHAHQRGVIHRDLKPGNILVGDDSVPKILDFGLARGSGEPDLPIDARKDKTDDPAITLPGGRPGTKAYMPLDGAGEIEEATTRTDVYGLGVVLFGLLTRTPQRGGGLEELIDRIRNRELRRPGEAIDRELEAILKKALAIDPAGRYESAGQLATDIDNYLQYRPLIARMPHRVRYVIGRKLRRHLKKIVVCAVGAIVIAACATGALHWWQGRLSEEEAARLSQVIEYIDSGGDPNGPVDPVGLTRLHLAARDGYPAVVDYLLYKGASANVADKNGWTPLHLAAMRGRTECAETLLSAGADIDFRSNKQWTALHLGARRGHPEVVELLLSSGADPGARTDKGWTAIHGAADKGHVRIVRLLAQAGTSVSALSASGRTGLHFAASSGHMNTVRALLELGSPLDIRDEGGRTALHFAAGNGYRAIAELLIEQGSDPGVKDAHGMTPLEYACQKAEELRAQKTADRPPDEEQLLADLEETVAYLRELR